MSLENKTISINLFEKLVDVMPYGIIVANIDSEFILHNTVARHFFDSELQDTTENRWSGEYGIFSLDKTVRYTLENTPAQRALRGEVVKYEKYFIKSKIIPQGFYLKVSSYPIYSSVDCNVVEAAAVVFEDITEEQEFYDNVINKFEEIEKYLREVLKIDNTVKNTKNDDKAIHY